jgi:signal transduction histidine kinase
MSGAAAAASRARPLAAVALGGLIAVLAGRDTPARWRSPWRRRAAHSGLALATVVLIVASLISVAGIGLPFQINRLTSGPSVGRAKVIGGVFRPAVQSTVTVNYVMGGSIRLHGGATPYLLNLLMPGGVVVFEVLTALAVVAALPLAARYPLLGWRIAWLLLLVPLTHIDWLGRWRWNPVQIVVLLVVFCVAGRRQPRPVLWWMWALSLIPWWLWADKNQSGLIVSALGMVAFTAATLAVDAMRSRRHTQDALADQEERTELERARRAVLEERARIARELHDVVAHHMSLVAVRAETAPYRLAGLDDAVRGEFGSLSETAREALSDMRRLLGVLRYDQPAGRSPQPRLSDLPELIETSRKPACRSGWPRRPRWRCPPAWACAPTGSCRSRSPTPGGTRPVPRSP